MKAETIENGIDDIPESIHMIIKPNRQKFLRKGLGWVIDSVINIIVNMMNCSCCMVDR